MGGGAGWGGVAGRRRDREKEIEMGRGKLPFNQETPLIQTNWCQSPTLQDLVSGRKALSCQSGADLPVHALKT